MYQGSSAGNNADNKSGNKSGNVPKVIFATYQSSDVIERALKNSGVTIDLAIADEAHRTATKVDSEFSSMLDDEKIPAIKRLFLTATPKIYMQREDEDGEGDVELISMNDESRYGKVVHKYSFRQAVRDGVICDYEVVAIGVSEKDLADQDLADKLGSGTRGNLYDLYLASSRIALAKAVNELGIRNIITFHSSIAKAENYTLGSGGAHLREELERVNPEGSLQFNLNTVNSHMKVEDREKILDKMSENVGGRERGVVHVTSNCKVLSEGVDVRSLDGVQIVDAKSSEIENVQIIGRVMRKSPGKEKGYILVPIVLREGGSIEEAAKDKRLKPLISVIEALKAEDEDLVIELQKRVARENEEGKKGEDEDVNGGENYGEESEEDIGEREDMEKDEKESEEKENEGEKGNGGGGVIRFIGVSEADRLRLQENLNLVIAKRCSEKYELTEEALKAAILKYAEDNDGKRPTQKSDGGVGSISWSAVQKRFKSAKEKAEQGKGDLLFGCKSFSDYVDKVLGKDPAKDFELTEEALKAAILKYVEDNEGRRPTQHSDGGVGPITWRRVEKRFKAAKENAEQGKGDLLFGCESLSDYVSMVLGKVAKRDFVLTEEVLKAAILKYVEDNEGRRPTQKSDGGVGPITWTGVEKRFQAARKKAAQGKGELLFGCESLSDYVDKVFGKVTAKGFVLTEEVLKAAILQYAKDNEGRRPNSGSDGGVGPLGWPGVAARFQAAKEKAEEGKGELLFGCESLSDYVDKVLGRDPAKDFVLKEEDLKAAVLKYVQDNKGKRPYAGIKKVAVGPLTWGGIDQRFWVARKKAEEGKGQLLFGCGSLSEFVEKCLR